MTGHLSGSILALAGIFYAAAFLLHLLSFFGVWGHGHRPGFFFMRIGFLFGTFYFVTEAFEHGYFLPVVHLSQAMAFFAWSLAFVYLVFLVRIQSESFGIFLTPILLFLVAVSLVSASPSGDIQKVVQANPVLRSPYFALHIVSAFFAYASFALSFVAGILYLIQHYELKHRSPGTFYHKLPSLEQLEKLIYQPITWGTVLLCTALAVGFLWSKSASGEFWIREPKTLLTAATIVLYLLILFLRHGISLRSSRVVFLSVLVFGVVVFSFFGGRFFQGHHNFLTSPSSSAPMPYGVS